MLAPACAAPHCRHRGCRRNCHARRLARRRCHRQRSTRGSRDAAWCRRCCAAGLLASLAPRAWPSCRALRYRRWVAWADGATRRRVALLASACVLYRRRGGARWRPRRPRPGRLQVQGRNPSPNPDISQACDLGLSALGVLHYNTRCSRCRSCCSVRRWSLASPPTRTGESRASTACCSRTRRSAARSPSCSARANPNPNPDLGPGLDYFPFPLTTDPNLTLTQTLTLTLTLTRRALLVALPVHAA